MEITINIDKKIEEIVDKKLSGLNCVLDKYTKGYMFDSLIYRFKDCQAKAFNYEVIQMKHQRNLSQLEAEERLRDRYDRDLMRFIQILDEAIGEHD